MDIKTQKQITSELQYLKANNPIARRALIDLDDGITLHGMSNGQWSLAHAIDTLADKVEDGADLSIGTWRARIEHLEMVRDVAARTGVRTVRFLVDFSFKRTDYNGRNTAFIRETFGDEAIRHCHTHAKFACFTGGQYDCLYLTTANLNIARRLETFTCIGGGDIPQAYQDIVSDVFEFQPPKTAWNSSKTIATITYKRITEGGGGQKELEDVDGLERMDADVDDLDKSINDNLDFLIKQDKERAR